jgi:hypothetical protein
MNRVAIVIQWGFLVIQFITAILAILCWEKSKSVFWRSFIIIWIVTFLIETTGKIMGSYGIHNLWLYNLFFVIFYPCIILFYIDIFGKKKLGWMAVISAIVLIVWSIVNLLTVDITLNLDTYYAIVAGTLIIFFALAYLIMLFFDKETTTPLRNEYYYWFSLGFVIYFSFNTILIGMYTKIIESKSPILSDFIFYATHLISFVLHICLWIGFRTAFKWMK